MIDQITNEIIISSQLLHTNNVSRIASELGYRPMLIITALYRGVEVGKITYDEKRDTIQISEDVEVEKLAVTEGTQELLDYTEEFMRYLNAREKDMTIDELRMLLGGIPDLHIRIVVFISTKLTSYELADLKDKKSIYTFITLTENVDEKFGLKQFKSIDSKTKKSRKK